VPGTNAPIWLIPTTAFRDWLAKSDTESPWATADRGKPASPGAVARAMRAFGIQPDKYVERKGADVTTMRGYRVRDLSPLWQAHLPRRA
jgi:hypothetical protein